MTILSSQSRTQWPTDSLKSMKVISREGRWDFLTETSWHSIKQHTGLLDSTHSIHWVETQWQQQYLQHGATVRINQLIHACRSEGVGRVWLSSTTDVKAHHCLVQYKGLLSAWFITYLSLPEVQWQKGASTALLLHKRMLDWVISNELLN